VNGFLMSGKSGFAVESAPAIVNTTQESQLMRGTIHDAMRLALMTLEIALVLKAAVTVNKLANIGVNTINLRIH